MSTAFFKKSGSTSDRLVDIHRATRFTHPDVNRIAIALYDSKTDRLRTFAHSSEGRHPLDNYQAVLSEVPSLKVLADRGDVRAVDNLSELAGPGSGRHTQAIGEEYRSSLTVPFYKGEAFAGFVFFNSRTRGYFTRDRCQALSLAAEVVNALVMETLKPVEMLSNSIGVAKDISHYRDEETGAHLDRVANYASLIAQHLADQEELDDEFIQMLFLFAPLHDLGKVAIPDNVLLKPDKLNQEELRIMRTHPDKGVEICDRLLDSMGFVSARQGRMLRNIIHYHHEAWDGSGYPSGLTRQNIPLEAAIVAVADVFDALTSARPYKNAWTTDAACDFLAQNAGGKFNPDCVAVFLDHREEVEMIQRRFGDGQHEVRRTNWVQSSLSRTG
ncbi:MAG: HD domain-containing protein [Rhodospirillum sp.]|nr:HD domain-containing protein [Rhodospirillum sp.]MCF8491558.1 HD domain-containing protein [Rhodospirillum sp.]MCF8501947.1 HD domain-containing protein [Rhodospirillum sp.]